MTLLDAMKVSQVQNKIDHTTFYPCGIRKFEDKYILAYSSSLQGEIQYGILTGLSKEDHFTDAKINEEHIKDKDDWEPLSSIL